MIYIVVMQATRRPSELSSTTEPEDLGKTAYYTARQFVKQNLKSPSKAKFSVLGADQNTGLEKKTDSQFKAWGYVDSQNSFGAMIRSDWRAVVEKVGDSWTLVFLQVGDQKIGDINEFNEPAFNSTPPPSGFRRFSWGDAPTGTLKQTTSHQDGTTMYVPQEGTKPEPLFDIPVAEEAFVFSHARFYSGMAWIDGRDNFEKMKAELNRRFGQPSSANPRISLWKWKWQDGPIEVSLSYQERFARTTVTFANKKY